MISIADVACCASYEVPHVIPHGLRVNEECMEHVFLDLLDYVAFL